MAEEGGFDPQSGEEVVGRGVKQREQRDLRNDGDR